MRLTPPLRRLLPFMVALIAIAASVPARAGAPDMKSYPSAELRDPGYHQNVHQKVGSAWKRPAQAPKEGARTVVIATILRDGSLMEGPRLHMKSGSDAWDAAAIDAVKRAAPFPPLPKSYPRTSLEVHFHFEYN